MDLVDAGMDRAGLFENTVVVITSDHGENLGDHGLYDHRMSLNRTVLNIPLVIRCPGVFEGGRVEDAVVRLEDVTATLLSLCGQRVPPAFHGRPLTEELGGRIARAIHGPLVRHETMMISTFPGVDTRRLQLSIRSVYDGRHHLVRYSDGREELFDIRSDPGETTDIAPAEPRVLERMRLLDLQR